MSKHLQFVLFVMQYSADAKQDARVTILKHAMMVPEHILPDDPLDAAKWFYNGMQMGYSPSDWPAWLKEAYKIAYPNINIS